MSEYWLGFVTPFVGIAGFALALGAAYLLVRAADWLNSRIHEHLVEKITIKKNLADPFGTRPERPEHYDKATKLRDALLESPKLWLIRGFGFMVLLVRDYREKD